VGTAAGFRLLPRERSSAQSSRPIVKICDHRSDAAAELRPRHWLRWRREPLAYLVLNASRRDCCKGSDAWWARRPHHLHAKDWPAAGAL